MNNHMNVHVNNHVHTVPIKNYLESKNIKFKEINNELISKCVFCDKDNHLYFSVQTGQYHCKRCGEAGNIFTLAKRLGDNVKDIIISNDNNSKILKPKQVKKLDKSIIEKCQKQLPDNIRQYLHGRGITDGQIRANSLGYGFFYGKWWITLPILDKSGNFVFLKLRKDPFDNRHKDKGRVWPKGSKAEIYGWEELNNDVKDMVVICEGEMDRLVLQNQGIPTITSTAGAGTFKDEWLPYLFKFKKIYICFDNDEAGKVGADKLIAKLENLKKTQKSKVSHLSDNDNYGFKLFRINLPDYLGKGGDVTDYFVKHNGNVDGFMGFAEEIKFKDNNKENSEKVKRIIKVKKPKKDIDFLDWKNIIQTNFPDLLFPAEIGISIMSQILIKDITNPFALVFVDVPSSGKTICINFFAEINRLTYATDKFSPASFVSNAANVSKNKLKDIDMLPRIRYKMFLLRDLATMFSKRDDDLAELMGTLTRVLDGEGLNTDSGVHGGRKYVGEYLFMMLAGSTPLPPKVWKIMGNLGSRLFFLNLNSKEKSEEEMVEQLTTSAYKKKEDECRIITKDFLFTLWNKYPDGIDWDKTKDEKNFKKIIIKCAKLLAHLRGTINTWKDNLGDSFDSGHITTNIEKPYRIGQLFYNLCRGHALSCGRTQINEDDLKLLIDITIDSAPNIRARLFRKLLDYNGSMTTTEVESFLNCSKPTALKEMDVFKILGICKIKQESYNTVGNPEKTMHLTKDFDWFLSDECKKLRNIPIDPEQSTMSDLFKE